MISKVGAFTLIVLLLTGGSSYIALGLAHRSALSSLDAELNQQLPARISQAGINSFSDPQVEAMLISSINADLADVVYQSSIAYDCHSRVLALDESAVALASATVEDAILNVQWQDGELTRRVDIGVDCQPDTESIVSGQLLVSFLLSFVLFFLPRPLRGNAQRRCGALMGAGVDAARCQALCSDPALLVVPEEGLPWVSRAIALGYTDAAAFAVGKAEDVLQFDAAHSRVTIHGLPIDMPATPFIYYFWYASCRLQQAEGWFTNPSIRKPDTENARQLIATMRKMGGHQKAINDLSTKGLRAKILDQNRSKIKDEVVRVLGEDLARAYLFEGERDVRTARYRYRLKISPQKIRLNF